MPSARLRIPCLALVAVTALMTNVILAAEEKKPEAKKLSFEADILPIFRAKCIRCHAGVEPKAGLNLARPSSLLSGGKSGSALRIGAAEFSLLYEVISSDRMPKVGQKLTAEEKGRIRQWINDGAEGVGVAATVDRSEDITDVELWSFRAPVRPATPQLDERRRIRNPIDAFVLSRLQGESLGFSAEADRATLIRRASYDLLGVPPAPDDVARFVQDPAPDAYERMIDRLLADPRYGERWARHWLDVAGYTESAGILFEDRPLPLAWRYRDYVIRAFNRDKPYDRFLQEQIAGDELTDYWNHYESDDRLPDDVVEGIIATGFLRTAADASRPDFNTIKNAHSQYYYPTLFDTLQVVCSSTMGVTVQCARCHSHKFDPIPQVDYYRLLSVFMSAYRPNDWVPQMKRRLLIASKKQKEAADKKNAEVDGNVKKLKDEQTQLKKQFTEKLFESKLGETPEAERDAIRAAFTAAKDKRDEEQKKLVEKYKTQLRPEGKELDAALEKLAEYKQQSSDLNNKIAAEERRRWLFDEVRALYDLPGEVTTPVLLRGDPLTPGPAVQPGVLTSLESREPFQWSMPEEKDSRTSGKRLAFARWLTQPRHPLTARVMVNRIWMHHFGVGIVPTPDDFGVSGAPPTHPELLDWLAIEFVESGWSVKHLHRLILASSTWRQTSRPSPKQIAAGKSADPDNRLLWRRGMRRLEAEATRDAVLAVSGSLYSKMYGYSHAVARQKNGEVTVPSDVGRQRRAVYIQVLRLNPETMLEVFDQPTIAVNCTQRAASTVSTQALTMLNSDAMVRAANQFAETLLRESPEDAASRALYTAFSRPPSAAEEATLERFLHEQAARHLQQTKQADRERPESIAEARKRALADMCHMLMCANEFIYIN